MRALWHTCKVVSAGLYWLLSVCFVWAGLVQLGNAPSWGWACLAFVLALFVGRGLLARRIGAGASYVAGCGAFAVFLIVAAVMTGYKL
ncbi:MAG TPA: hypothetical protein VG839_07515 [Asticcacaulis sp.]|nr:hypothetical protein [Asticcacaulis sp.]